MLKQQKVQIQIMRKRDVPGIQISSLLSKEAQLHPCMLAEQSLFQLHSVNSKR